MCKLEVCIGTKKKKKISGAVSTFMQAGMGSKIAHGIKEKNTFQWYPVFVFLFIICIPRVKDKCVHCHRQENYT